MLLQILQNGQSDQDVLVSEARLNGIGSERMNQDPLRVDNTNRPNGIILHVRANELENVFIWLDRILEHT